MRMAGQEYMAELTEIGGRVLAELETFVGGYCTPETPKAERDLDIGRELGMAVFLAALGDQGINRISLIEGFCRAVGEAMAQQPGDGGEKIRASVNSGLADGESIARFAFGQVGRA